MEGFCRGCLNKYDSEDLLQYCESNRRLFVYCTGLQVKRNDSITFQLCKECYLNMKFSCKFKKQCRNSDKKFKNFLAVKKEGENIDFSSFLKNTEDTLTLRLPIVSRSNTPSRQIAEDDDNVSTCTSIQNFMTDILQGEEMLPTEARIVREVIQEEADILDDSLDSHWLQDDISVNSDFGMEFNFSTFSTPHSIRNDHCYTPRRITDDNREVNYYMSKKPEGSSDETQIVPRNDMPILDDIDNGLLNDGFKIDYGIENINEQDKQLVNKTQQIDMPVLDVEFDGVVEDDGTVELAENYCSKSYKMHKTIDLCKKTPHNNVIIQEKLAEISEDDSPFSNLESFKDCLFSMNNGISPFANKDKLIVTKEETLGTKIGHESNEFSIILNKGIAGQKSNNDENNLINNSPFTQELEKYINKAKYKKTNKSVESKTVLNVKELSNLRDNSDQEDIIGKGFSPKKRKMDILYTVPVKRIHLACNTSKRKENLLNEEKCSIDRNLELALKNNESQKFSLDQLLMSPQVSIRSGASTPTINNILFGTDIPKVKDTVIEPKFENLDKKKELDSIEDFFKDDHVIRQSTPKKDLSRARGKPLKGFNDKHESQGLKESTKYWKPTRGMKDIRRLKELLKSDDDQAGEFSDDNQTVSSIDDKINTEEIEIIRESLEPSEQENQSETALILEEGKNNDKVQNENNEKFALQSEEVDDLDISISNLLNIDQNQSVDLNISISPDFLKDDKDHTPSEKNVSDDLFKKPLSPPDGKYDFDACYCKICDITFISHMALKRHFTKVHKVKIVRPISIFCHLCATECTSKSNFNRHMAMYHSAERYQCDYCKFGFPTKGKLAQHMRAHSDGFTRNNNIDENEDKKKFVCNTCGKMIKNSANFKLHLRRHTKSYTMTCEICQKGFYRKEDLQAHMNIHNNVNEFACQYCPKRYRRRSLWMHHTFRHLGIEKYPCNLCGKRFVSNEILKRHCDSKSCLKKRKVDTQDKSKSKGVTVIYSTGSNDKIKEITEKDNTDCLEVQTNDCINGGANSIETVDSDKT